MNLLTFYNNRCKNSPSRAKMRLTMRLSAFFLVCFMQANAVSFSQTVTITGKKMKLEKLLRAVENQTGYEFVFSSSAAMKGELGNVEFKNSPLKEVLDKCLGQLSLTYSITDKVISIIPVQPAPVPTEANPVKVAVAAPDIIINGRVTNAAGLLLRGVSVLIRGTDNGTTTNEKGEFTLKVPGNGAVLEVSYIGYASQTVKAGNQTQINIVLITESKNLNDFVVVGYGAQKKVDVTGAVVTINTSSLVNRPVTSLTNSLQGQAPGVTILGRGGDVGHDIGSINIRGRGNLATSEPMYVVDGVPVGSDVFARIDPMDIASISILKDASAAIYGSRAAYGVMLVTTKRGSAAGKMSVNYNAYYGTQSPVILPHYVGSLDYANLLNEANANIGSAPSFTAGQLQAIKSQSSPDSFPDNNWEKLAFLQSAPLWQHELNITGGGTTRYFISGAIMKQGSLFPNEALTRYSARSNTESQVSKIFKIGTNVSFIRDEINNKGQTVSLTSMYRMLPLSVNKQSDGSWGTITGGQVNSALAANNPVRSEQQGGHSENAANRFLSNITGNLKPIAGLNIDGSFAYNFTNQTVSTFNNYLDPLVNFVTKTPIAGTGQVSSLSESWYNYSTLLAQVYGSYERKFGEHFGKIMAGTSYESDKIDTITGFRDNFPSNSLDALVAGAQNGDVNNAGHSLQRVLISYFGRANYSFKDRYLLELVMRADASSQFAPGHRWGYFPSISAAWKISDEAFMKNISWVNSLKLRGSYGSMGNVNNVGYYDYLDVLSISTVAVLNGNPVTGVYPSSAANPNLTWETVISKNIGLDADLFGHALNVQLDVYDKLTKNILLQLPQPQEFGYQIIPSQNAGRVDNKGIELNLSHSGSIGKVQFTIGGNLTKIWNKIVDLHGQDNQVTGTYYIDKQGQSIGSFYMYKALGLFKDSADVAHSAQSGTASPGDIKYADLSGPNGKPDGQISSYDRTIVGNDVPYFNYGLSLNVRYKGFDLMVNGQGVTDVKVYLEEESSQAFFNGAGVKQYVLGRWTQANPNPNAVYPRLLTTANNAQNLQLSSFWLFNAAYFRFKTISLGYTLPSTFLSTQVVKSLRFYVSSNNAFTIRGDHRMKDFDPEAPSQRAAYPQLKTFSFGVNATF
jgi:TonB-linked SusC/RagA family outer membrane protein